MSLTRIAMASYTPTTTRQGQNANVHQHNVYMRRRSDDVELDVPIPSFRRTEHTLMDTFREHLNLCAYRESLNTSTCDNEILDEDLGHPPVTHDTPPGTHMESLQSDSTLSTIFRSRSRSDATSTPLSCRQSVGTIVLFPNRSEKQSNRRNFHSERHSVCIADLPELKTTGSSISSNHLFVDAKLANVAVRNINNLWHRPSNAVEMRSSIWNLPRHSNPAQLMIDRNDTFEKHQSPLIDNNVMQISRRIESEPSSPFSNYAILIKESSFNLSSEQLSLYPPYDGAPPEFFKVIFESQDAVYSSFMRAHKCYDLIPTSTKLVVFDTELQVKKAFFALIYNGVRAAPLWDSKKQEFVGMLTITDFIRVLQKYYINSGSRNEGIENLEKHKIATWRRELERDGHLKLLAYISPSESLFQAVEVLCKEKVHRLPVMEECTGNIAFILTHKRLMKFLYLYMIDLPRPSFMDKTPLELGIGTWSDVLTITQNTPLIDVMNIFISKRVSALPVLDENGKVVDIYAKFDAINLAANKSYIDLNVTAQEALRHRVDWFEGVRCCSPNDSLMTIVEMIVRAEVHRLVIVDGDKKVKGIISLSDILRFLVLEPPVAPPGNNSPDFALDDVMGRSDREIYIPDKCEAARFHSRNMLPFGGPPAFSPLMNIPPAAAAASQATYLQQQVIMPPLQRIPVMTVSSAPTSLQLPQVSVASPATTPRPMLVPPQMQMEIAAASHSPHTSSIGTTLITSDIWSEHTASDGRVYYYNKVTKQSSWQKPDELKTPEEKKLAAAKLWREYKTPEGRPYYYNIETKETTWICPKDFDPAVVTKAKNGVESKGSDTSKIESQNGGESELEKAMLATLKSLEEPNGQIGNTKEADAEDAEEEKDLKQKQSDKFRDLLRDKYNEGKISSTSSWEQAMRYIQHDSRFRILNKVSEKKQLFNAWKVQRQKEERTFSFLQSHILQQIFAK
ncbi:5'-AMP-activated protein [Dirofilaria immitis]